MKQTVRKWFWVWDFDKEERWLNEMARQGKCLTDVGFCKYVFEDCAPGEWQICMELLEKSPASPEGRGYLNFLEETGAQQVGRWMRWVYFRKRTADGPFDLFSDNRSRIGHLTRIIRFILPLAWLNLVMGLLNTGVALLGSEPGRAVGIVNLVIGILALAGARRLKIKRERLEHDARIFE